MAKSVPRAECQALTKAWACAMHWGSGNDENVNLSKAAAMLITPFLVSSIFIAKTLSFFYSQYLVLDVKNTEHCFALSLHYCFHVPLRLGTVDASDWPKTTYWGMSTRKAEMTISLHYEDTGQLREPWAGFWPGRVFLLFSKKHDLG